MVIVQTTLLRGCIALLLLYGCATRKDMVNHVVTTASPYGCCRMINYQVLEFAQTERSTLTGDSVAVRLLPDSVTATCGTDAEVPLVIANNTASDIYIPISRELEGDRIKLYPWRLYYEEKKPVRLARQIQFGDLLERTDGRLAFHRIPPGREVRLRGVIPGNWLCVPPTDIPAAYLERELDPTYYADYSRTLRDESARYGKKLPLVGLRYDVAYTPLDFWHGLPGVTEHSSPGGDTVYTDIKVKDTPASFLNSSQRVAVSNVIMVRLLD
jgi:hypothetical protein